MIVFDLCCSEHHVFEAWFDSTGAYDQQLAAKLIACPLCNDSTIRKALTAPNVSAKSNQRTARPRRELEGLTTPSLADSAPAATPVAAPDVQPTLAEMKAMMARLATLQSEIETSHTDVGDAFPEEVRKIHYGDAAPAPIYGVATPADVKDLHEEGIAVMPLPFRTRKSKRLDG